MSGIRVGTCSWTDPTMVRAWYPPSVRTAADRLRYYAAHFDTVEVDSSFYGMPTPATARLWAERTPPGFVFHVKAFGMLTRHGVKPEQLPPPLRDGHTLRARPPRPHPPPGTRLCARRPSPCFSEALEPLRAEGKLGLILMQFPPYFVANEANREYIAQSARRLAPDRMAVEFRHVSWVEPDELEQTLGAAGVAGRLLRVRGRAPDADGQRAAAARRRHRRHRATCASTAATPPPGTPGCRPRPSASATSTRRRSCPSGWSRSAACSEQTQTTYVMFNNCFADYAPRNAQQMLSLLDVGRSDGGPRRAAGPQPGAARVGAPPPRGAARRTILLGPRGGPLAAGASPQTLGRFFIASLIFSSGYA